MHDMLEHNCSSWMLPLFVANDSYIHDDFRRRMVAAAEWALVRPWQDIHPVRALMEWTIAFGFYNTEKEYCIGWHALLDASYNTCQPPYVYLKSRKSGEDNELVRPVSSRLPPSIDRATGFERHTSVLFTAMCLTPLVMSRWQSPVLTRGWGSDMKMGRGRDPWGLHADAHARSTVSREYMLSVLMSFSPASTPKFGPFNEPYVDIHKHANRISAIVAALLLRHLPVSIGELVGSLC